ncbi:DNA polymerase III subunit beta [Chitinispirillales bacterium ANBcel5]|uniref:DNA polymerase III subunit beta n=1 Tax=Cellulosispirillum alkaliphilum TaxID=3039283 RepID=UPI002A52F59D|nr:DNA polymerase III subunit beta [Chitinispirillales bacterium ANBcel5]
MSVLIQKKDLLDLMQKAFPLIPTKSSLQILSNFKISYIDSKLEISATDLDHSMKVFAPAEGEAPFDITVNARKIFEIVRELPDGIVSMEIDETVLILESERGFSCKIAGADSQDFPGFPENDSDNSFHIKSSSICEIISKSSFAVAKDESRAALCGILWEIFSDKTGMVSTDGHRLGSSFLNVNLPVEDGISGILSPRSVSSLSRILNAKSEDMIDVILGDKYVTFQSPDFIMCSKLIEGTYPDYTKVIPKNNPKEAVVDRVMLLNAVKRVSVLSNQKTHLVKFTFKNGMVEIVVLNREIGGEARDSIPIEYEGDDHVVGFNGQYFTEILDIIETPKIRIEMNTQISACLLFPVYEKEEEQKKSDDLFLIMPLRIMEEVLAT